MTSIEASRPASGYREAGARDSTLKGIRSYSDTDVTGPRTRRCCCCILRDKNPAISKLAAIQEKLKEDRPKTTRWSWVESFELNVIFSFVIFLNAACIGIDIETSQEDGSSHPVMLVLESVFLAIFWVELTLRIIARGPRLFCLDPWGPFDFSVTLLGSLDAWVFTPVIGSSELLSGLSALRTMRLLRLARLLRVFRHFKQLTQLVRILTGAFQALTWVSLLLFLVVYVFVIITLMLLQNQDLTKESPELQRLDRGLGWTMFYHLFIVTCEGHLDYLVYPTVELHDIWYIYWVIQLVFLNFFMVNLMVGIIVQKTLVKDEEEDELQTNFVYEADSFKRTLLTLFDISDTNQDGVLQTSELRKLLLSDTLQEIMLAFGIRTDVPIDFLISILGFQHERYITFKRFYENAVRVCGASKDIRTFMLQYDTMRMNEEVTRDVKRIMQKMGGKGESSPKKNVLALPSKDVVDGFGSAKKTTRSKICLYVTAGAGSSATTVTTSKSTAHIVGSRSSSGM